MRATQESKQLKLPRGRGSGWRWSSCRTPNEGSYSCLAVGLSSVASRGLLVSGGWHVTTSGFQKRWQGCISSPLLLCLLLASFNLLSSLTNPLADVHNTL